MVEILHSNSITDSATLTAKTLVNHDSAHTNLKEAFLLKTVMITGHIKTPDLTDRIYLVFAYGDPTIAEIKVGLESEVNDPEDTDAYRLGQIHTRRVIDVMALDGGNTTGAERGFSWKPRLPAKGLPFAKGGGWKFQLYNPSTGALTNGPTVTSWSKAMGAWMR